MFIFQTQRPSKSNFNYLRESLQPQIRQGIYSTSGVSYLKRDIHYFNLGSGDSSGRRRLADYFIGPDTIGRSKTSHRPSKGCDLPDNKHDSGCFGGKGGRSHHTVCGEVRRYREKKTSHKLEQQKTAPLMGTTEIGHKGTTEKKAVIQEGSVLFQGRKNHNHEAKEGKKYQKHRDDGAKTAWPRTAKQLMVNLSEASSWCSETTGGIRTLEQGVQRRVKEAKVPRTYAMKPKPLRANLNHANKVFGKHLGEVASRIKRHENYMTLMKDQVHRHAKTEKTRDLTFRIKEGVEDYRKSSKV